MTRMLYVLGRGGRALVLRVALARRQLVGQRQAHAAKHPALADDLRANAAQLVAPAWPNEAVQADFEARRHQRLDQQAVALERSVDPSPLLVAERPDGAQLPSPRKAERALQQPRAPVVG